MTKPNYTPEQAQEKLANSKCPICGKYISMCAIAPVELCKLARCHDCPHEKSSNHCYHDITDVIEHCQNLEADHIQRIMDLYSQIKHLKYMLNLYMQD